MGATNPSPQPLRQRFRNQRKVLMLRNPHRRVTSRNLMVSSGQNAHSRHSRLFCDSQGPALLPGTAQVRMSPRMSGFSRGLDRKIENQSLSQRHPTRRVSMGDRDCLQFSWAPFVAFNKECPCVGNRKGSSRTVAACPRINPSRLLYIGNDVLFGVRPHPAIPASAIESSHQLQEVRGDQRFIPFGGSAGNSHAEDRSKCGIASTFLLNASIALPEPRLLWHRPASYIQRRFAQRALFRGRRVMSLDRICVRDRSSVRHR